MRGEGMPATGYRMADGLLNGRECRGDVARRWVKAGRQGKPIPRGQGQP